LAWRARKLDKELLSIYCNPDECDLIVNNYEAFVDAYFDRTGDIKGVPVELCNKLCESFTSTGGIEDIDREIERFRLFEKAGQTQLSIRLHDNPMEALKIIGERVIPAFRN
jgi:hypothetical protein